MGLMLAIYFWPHSSAVSMQSAHVTESAAIQPTITLKCVPAILDAIAQQRPYHPECPGCQYLQDGYHIDGLQLRT